MEENKKTIAFEVSEKDSQLLDLSLKMLDMDANDAFKFFIRDLSFRALRSARNEINEGPQDRRFNELAISPFSQREVDRAKLLKLKIQRWAKQKSGISYQILHVFFELTQKDDNYCIKRKVMKDRYCELYGDNDEDAPVTFINTFRQMCSDSIRAYGLIFKYCNDNSEDEVYLHPNNKDFILELKDEFLK